MIFEGVNIKMLKLSKALWGGFWRRTQGEYVALTFQGIELLK